MSDYFLNKIYDSLLTNKVSKTKSTFRTLSESYDLVYEEEQSNTPSGSFKPVTSPEQPAQQQSESVSTLEQPEEQPKTEQYTPKKLPTNFNTKQRVYPRQLWTNLQRELFKDSEKTGTGKGETAVANLISNINDRGILEKMISGQGESYDVAWPPLGMFEGYNKNNLEFKFEVKELEFGSEKDTQIDPGTNTRPKAKTSVRIGVEGRGFAVQTLAQIEQSITNLLDEYQMLSTDEQRKVDKQIIEKHIGGTLQEPPARAAQKKKAQYEMYKNWSLGRYLTAVKESSDSGELPPSLLFGVPEEPKPGRYNTGIKKDLIIMSIKKLFQIFKQTDASEITSSEYSTTVGSLKDFFYKNYLPQPTEANQEVVQDIADELNKKAKTVDREIIKFKAKKVGQTFTAVEFFKELKQLPLATTLEKLQQVIYRPDTIATFFPTDLTGFFAVNRNGYIYIPRNELSNFLEFDTFSSGGVKVRLKVQ
jgi:hypothetical protein